MSRCKSRGKRHHIPLARSQNFGSEMDLIDDSHSDRVSFLNRSSSPTPIAKSSCGDGESGVLSDTGVNGVSADGLKEMRIRNGFSLTSFSPSENAKSLRSKLAILGPPMNKLADSITSLNSTCTDGRSNKRPKSPSTSSQQSENPPDIISSTKSKLDGVNLPSFEESIVDGFSVMAFKDQSDLELYARLTGKVAEEVPSRRTGSRVASSGSLHGSGRQRRGCVGNNAPGMSRASGRGRRSAGSNSTSDHVSSNGIDAEPADGRTSNDIGGSRESPRLGPLHLDISSPTVNTGAASRKRLCGSRADEAKENCQRFSNGGLGSLVSSDSKTFPVLSLKSGASNNSSSNISSTSAPKRNLFSIEALTAVEKKEPSVETGDVPDACSCSQQQQQQQQMHPPSVPQISAHQDGHLLTSVQWLERLKKCVGPKGFLVPIHEAEMHQLAHLLTDRDFKEEVARIPYASQMLSNFCAHQQQQRCRRIPTTQSFVNSFNAQQNSAGSSKAFPPPQLTSQGGSDSTLAPTGTAHHYPPPSFFSSAAAVAAAIAAAASSTSAGIRPPTLYLGPGQSMLPSQFLPGPSGSQSQPPSSHPHQPIPPRHLHPALSQPRQQYHTAMTDSAPPLSSPHMPISLWNAQQSHPHEFASLMQSPNLNAAAHMRKASASDAVDLTSPASGGNNSLKQLTAGKTPLPSPIPPLPPLSAPHFGFPSFWPNQRPPHAAMPSPPARHLLPLFTDLFRFSGLYSNRGATAHLRICYHIMKTKMVHARPFSLNDPWWYVEPGPTLLKPTAQKQSLPSTVHPPRPQIPVPRFSNYEHFIRAAIENGGMPPSALRPALLPPPPPPIAIDLTRSPPPRKSVPYSDVVRYLQPPSQQMQQHYQESELMTQSKRRRTIPEGGPLPSASVPPPPLQGVPQVLTPAHFQNGGGIRVPLGFPFPHPHFHSPP